MLPTPVPVQRSTLAPGHRGTAETVAVMARLAAGSWGSGSVRIRDLALSMVRGAGVPARQPWADLGAVHAGIQRLVRYTRDPVGQETIQAPEHTAFMQPAGDCDDLAVLEAALLGALGYPTRFVTSGMTRTAFSHVYLDAFITPPGEAGRWVPLDPTVPGSRPGWELPQAMLRHRWPVNRPEGFDPTAALPADLGALPFIPLVLLGGGLTAAGAVAGYVFGRGVDRALSDFMVLAALGTAGWWFMGRGWGRGRKRG